MKPFHMFLLFAFFGFVLEAVAIFLGVASMALTDPPSHRLLGATIVICIWPTVLISELQGMLGIPEPSSI